MATRRDCGFASAGNSGKASVSLAACSSTISGNFGSVKRFMAVLFSTGFVQQSIGQTCRCVLGSHQGFPGGCYFRPAIKLRKSVALQFAIVAGSIAAEPEPS